MLSVAFVTVTVHSADGRRVIIPRGNLKPSGTDVSWHCSFNPCSSPVNLWLLLKRYDAISRQHMRAAFASVLQSCDELRHSDSVTRFRIAEAGTSITSRLNPISSFTTGHLSRNISFSIVRFTSVSSPKGLFRRHVSSYISFRRKHILPAGMSSSIIANTSSMALVQVY